MSLSDEDKGPERWDIPDDIVPKAKSDFKYRLSSSDFQIRKDKFSFSLGQDFGPVLGKELLIDTDDRAFIMQDKFIQLDMKVATQKIYGFGERQREFTLGEGAYTMWTNGQETPYDDGTGGKQIYGVHPFCLIKAKTRDRFFGIFFRNSNAQAVVITHNQTDGSANLSYMTTGGNL